MEVIISDADEMLKMFSQRINREQFAFKSVRNNTISFALDNNIIFFFIKSVPI